ncbi:MAG: hypothetical protein Q8927_08245 [Bacteroidota bacterium]|nr:hypothetical protein [Bacteroidota bacterium]MDP4216177.1 hypothetical protein [Bacteroidota bacterium]MDP4247049.1 hypothetical protein [Bacteroidota bacterium]MDP4255099.1 hypothetical protein [Bacteroidota bacterium]MDP4258331.1 hypothetical protein [Bacteroidota bacterium]
MKNLSLIAVLAFFASLAILGQASCTQNGPDAAARATIDSLRNVINDLRPGLGEFMIQMKYHHDRLGEAIAAKDYERAAYEVGEMQETGESIVKLQITNDHLKGPFPVYYEKYLKTPLATLGDAAGKKDDASLHINFITLTNNCNSCHQENNMAFMKIQIAP